MPLTKGGPHNRVSSPCGGGSTFTTVAPISAISIVHIGPERIRDRSRTKISSSGVMQAARPSATAAEVSGTDSSVVVLAARVFAALAAAAARAAPARWGSVVAAPLAEAHPAATAGGSAQARAAADRTNRQERCQGRGPSGTGAYALPY